MKGEELANACLLHEKQRLLAKLQADLEQSMSDRNAKAATMQSVRAEHNRRKQALRNTLQLLEVVSPVYFLLFNAACLQAFGEQQEDMRVQAMERAVQKMAHHQMSTVSVVPPSSLPSF